jgi:hypothetical protein
LGSPSAREREFKPLGHVARVRVYRFRVGDSRDSDAETVMRQFAAAREVGH